MAEQPAMPEPIVGLTLRYLDGQLSEAEVAALAENLRADPMLVDRFVEICFQEQLVADIGIAALHDEDVDAEVSAAVMLDIIRRDRDERLIEAAQAAKPKAPEPYRRAVPPPHEMSAPRRVIVIPRWAVYGPIAAVLLIVASIVFTLKPAPNVTPPGSTPQTQADTDTIHAAAQLVRVHGAVWASIDGTPGVVAPGPLLAGQDLELLEGVAEVRMTNGARVYLQGATSVRVTSPSSIQLNRGRLSAKVSGQAEGFQVRTPQSQIVDHGTEFGVVVSDTGEERAEVFVGEVSLAPIRGGSAAPAVTLSGGQGLAISAAGSTQAIRAKAVDYVRDEEFEALMLAQAGSAYHRWLAYTFEIKRDPSVVAFYVFDPDDAQRNRLVNQIVGAHAARDGFLGDGANISPPTWGDGRFEQTRSLSFGIDPHGDCRGVVVPDSDALDFDSEMTIAVWVRFDRSSGSWNTLLSKRDIPPANLNYQLSLSGQWYDGHCRFQFGTGLDNQDVTGFDESPLLQRAPITGWQHVVVVSDGTTLRYYIDGERVFERNQPQAPEVSSAPLLIGTSSPELRPPLQGGLRPLNGAISEVLLARRAMADREIQALYQAGRPQE